MGFLRGLARVVLGLALSVVFIMAAAVKLSPQVNKEVHEELAQEFAQKYSEIWMVSEFGITHEEFRMAIGGLEIVLVLLLWVLPRFSALMLSSIMAGAIYTHYAAHDPPVKMAVCGILMALLFAFMLLSGPQPKTGKKKRA
ncbi:hypothetical protein PTSG_04218 [Salpingoeca rosetta]|uniref:Transmembrane protein 35A n=1 Tax=Salpingoeca rosetta (strain ATCC 50818 / BSB-021) TaxID=946362 RepID=F2U6X8_SALR5|nr:uncharacterized protein PTSG_04218 [Salpingoeca rosetta]EGD83610.1 hypothetical protein PTSG_04218 [Salpingoeca rosetta]|eukprot:XP_004995114.1 hypothetical protein PTSG_04218 [Salpingoeca rosetta]